MDIVTEPRFRIESISISTTDFRIPLYGGNREANSYTGGNVEAVNVVCYHGSSYLNELGTSQHIDSLTTKSNIDEL